MGITKDYIDDLICRVKAANFPGKANLLRDLLTAKKLVARGIPVNDKPGSAIALAANKIFVAKIDTECDNDEGESHGHKLQSGFDS